MVSMKKTAEHVLALGTHATDSPQRMDGKDSRDKGAAPKSAGHPAQNQKSTMTVAVWSRTLVK